MLSPTFKPVSQQMLQVALILTVTRLGAGKKPTCTDFVAKSRTNLYNDLNCCKADLNTQHNFSTRFAAMFRNKLQVFCCPFSPSAGGGGVL